MAGDIALAPDGWGDGDARFMPGDVLTDAGLQTAVFVSLFTDARSAELGEGGFWGDAMDDLPIGSLLWTLRREKMTADLPRRVRQMCLAALQWMVDQKIASAVQVTVERMGLYGLAITVEVTKPEPGAISQKFDYNWANQGGVI